MSYTLTGKLVVAISSRALFDFEEENRIFESTDDSAYMKLQLERLSKAARLEPGWIDHQPYDAGETSLTHHG